MKEFLKPIIIFLLAKESEAVLKKYNPKIVAITGTVGKTSTRDAIYAALSEFEYARKSPKNFNTEFGIPLTILDVSNPGRDLLGWLKVLMEGLLLIILPNHYPKWLVLEVGTDRPGDIEAVTKWLKPDVVIVTRLAKVPVHVENFPDFKDVFEEKGNLVRALKAGGTLILNADDEDVMEYKNLTQEKVELFRNGKNYEIVYEGDRPVGIKFEVEGQIVSLQGTLGEQHMQHASAALALVRSLGEDLTHAAKSLSSEVPAPGRMRLVDGITDSTIIDDTYNSSPVALEEALKTLQLVKAKRKIAVLGDMLELGRFSVDEHRKAGERAKECADVLVTVGVRAKMMDGDQHFVDSREAGKFLKDFLKEGDIVLVKGSQGVRMERAVEAIMANPKDKEKLLVRFDKEWKNK